MNSQETEALQAFLDQLVQARGVAKDPHASALIAQAASRQPDAAYLLVQRAMLVEQALAVAKAQIAELQAAQGGVSGGFLNPADAWGNSAASASSAQSGFQPSQQPVQQPMQQPGRAYASAPVAAAPGFLGGGMGGMLGTVAATAAGVAGGAFLYQGIEHLLHPQSSPASHPAPAQSGLADLDQPAAPLNHDGFADMVPSDQSLSAPESVADLDGGGIDNSDTSAA